MRRIARRQLNREQPGHTLDSTALVHEAYFRLVDQTRVAWADRSHFFAVAAQAMHRVLVDYARQYQAEKRGGAPVRVSLADDMLSVEQRAETLLVIDDALHRLAQLDERLSQVVECRFFGGLTEEETAHALGVTARTVRLIGRRREVGCTMPSTAMPATTALSPDQWRQVFTAADEALDLPTERREAFIAERCADDPALGVELRELLASAEAVSPLDTSAAALAAPLVAELSREPTRSRYRGIARTVFFKEIGRGGMGRRRTSPNATTTSSASATGRRAVAVVERDR